jgi:hypothetical protein
MGYIPHVVMPTFKGGSYTNKHLIKDQVAPEHFWGLIHQGTRPRINPCPRHGYPGTYPGALDISRDFNCLVPDQEPQSSTGGPHKGLYCLVPDQEPQGALIYWGGPCLVPDQEPQSSRVFLLLGPRPRTPVIYWGPLQGSFAMALTVWSQTKSPGVHWGP